MAQDYPHNFLVMRGCARFKEKEHIVWDQSIAQVVFESDDSNEAVAEAEKRNGGGMK